MLDKILVFLMIMMLPVGVFVISRYQGENPEDIAKREAAAAEQKIDKMIEDMKTANTKATPAPVEQQIEISSVSYATSSGELMVKGVAPGKNLTVMVSVVPTYTPKATKEPKVIEKTPDLESTESADLAEEITVTPYPVSVLGESVEVIAVKADGNGAFTYIRKIGKKEKIDLLDIRFDQSNRTATIQYNFIVGERTL